MVRFPTPKLNIIFITMSRGIKLYVQYCRSCPHGVVPTPVETGTAKIYCKPLRSLSLNHTYSCSLCQGAANATLHVMVNDPIS